MKSLSMKTTPVAIVAMFALLLASKSAPADGYSEQRRIEHVGAVLRSLLAMGEGRDRLEAELAKAARQRCGASNTAPRLECLIAVARQICAGQGPECHAVADVIVVNLRMVNDLIDERTRRRLIRTSADYHAALLAEAQLRYAALAAELVIEDSQASSPLGADSAAGEEALPVSPRAIANFCMRRDYRAKPPRCSQPSPTCVPSLSWQRCVAALTWFVTTPVATAPAAAP